VASGLVIDHGPRDVRVSVFGVQLDSASEIGERLLVTPRFQVRFRATDVIRGNGTGRSELDRAGQVSQSFVEAAKTIVGQSAVKVRLPTVIQIRKRKAIPTLRSHLRRIEVRRRLRK
jgi:hypothetical protein